MDIRTFDQLLFELRSVSAAKTRTPIADLTPGCVIASGPWERHVVVELPKRLNDHTTTLVVPLRHLHGGHTVRPYLPDGDTEIEIYQARAGRLSEQQVPVVPRCVVPDEPAVGDRIVMQWHDVNQLGVSFANEFDGKLWRHEGLTGDGRPMVESYSTASMRHIVGTTDTPSRSGWYVYLPAGQLPHLYVGGRPVPARTAEELQTGDVMLLPGGGRLQVEHITTHADGRTLHLHVLVPSRHLMRHLTWASKAGDRITHEDSGRLGMLYATEPRPGELVTAADLAAGDTVIAAWGAPYSHVAVVEELWPEPVCATLRTHPTTTTGFHVHTQSGLSNRYFVLRRAAAVAPAAHAA